MKKLFLAILALGFLFNSAIAEDQKHVPLVTAIAVKSCNELLGFIFSRADGTIVLTSNTEEEREMNQLMIESVPQEQRKVLDIRPPGGCAIKA